MAAYPNYSTKHIHEDQRHLLSPSLSSPNFSAGQPSPQYYKSPPSPDIVAIKTAQQEDTVSPRSPNPSHYSQEQPQIQNLN